MRLSSKGGQNMKFPKSLWYVDDMEFFELLWHELFMGRIRYYFIMRELEIMKERDAKYGSDNM